MTTPARDWRPILVSSAILSLALLGDALLYAVLPLHAATFGISLVWVGVLLSANRFVRVFAYGLVARATARVGIRRTCLLAALGAVLSTGLYGLGEGPAVLLLARVLWGLVYAALLLITLAYAVEYRAAAGARIGVSRTVQRVGPILALALGAWLTGLLGPQTVFVLLTGVTALALPLVYLLPPDPPRATTPAPPTRALGRPRAIDILFFLQGLGVDGVFAVTITVILAREMPVATAVLLGGMLLALRHIGEAVAAPAFGWFADRHGARGTFLFAMAATILGFAAIASGLTLVGALAMLVFRGALASLGPALIVQGIDADEPAVGHLARMQAWRDLGAALGPLGAAALLPLISPEAQHALVALLLALALLPALRRA